MREVHFNQRGGRVPANCGTQFAGCREAGSSLVARSKMNDPTQFEQVDETCEFGGAVLYSESLDMTAFLGIDAPRKI